jgi:signal transduction histidine kinase
LQVVLADEAAAHSPRYFQGVRKRLWAWARRYWFDAVLLLGTTLACVELAFNRGGPQSPTKPLWQLVPLMLLMMLPLLARRQFPFGAPVASALAFAAASFVDGHLVPFSFFLFLTVLAVCFLFGMLAQRRQALVGLSIVLICGAVVAGNDPDSPFEDVVPVFLAFIASWLGGFGLGFKFRQVTAAEERAARFEREREERARVAVTEERARIARELHDVVGHSVSVMTVQASAVRRLLRPEQERERDALLVVEQTGREALAEMRRMVGVLRRPEEAPVLAPQPSLEHLNKLVEQAREAGLPVELHVEGDPRPLPAGVDLTAYRLVQEGLTNALKHAKAERAEVLVRYEAGDIEVTVSDDGQGAGSEDGGGHGLVGMRERVAVYGGELEAGPRPEGGYRLRAKLPVVPA